MNDCGVVTVTVQYRVPAGKVLGFVRAVSPWCRFISGTAFERASQRYESMVARRQRRLDALLRRIPVQQSVMLGRLYRSLRSGKAYVGSMRTLLRDITELAVKGQVVVEKRRGGPKGNVTMVRRVQ